MNYISSITMPILIFIILLYGWIEKVRVYDVFTQGAKEGFKTVIKLFPTLLGIFLAVGALRSSGILDMFTSFFSPIVKIFHIPAEILPLIMLRPISGSASMIIATDLMAQYGVDSIIGLIASTIMGATETTFYAIAIYTSAVGVKKIRFVLAVSLIAEFVGIMVAIFLYTFF